VLKIFEHILLLHPVHGREMCHFKAMEQRQKQTNQQQIWTL